MEKISLLIVFMSLGSIPPVTAQTVTLQFMQSEYDIKGLHMIDTLNGFAAGEIHWNRSQKDFSATILKTTDGGMTWSPGVSPVTENFRDICFIDVLHGWVCGENGTILHTADGGVSWRLQDVGTDLDLRSIFFTDGSHGWVAGNEEIHELFDEPDAWSGKIWHTSDGGESWVQQSLPADAGIIHRLWFMDGSRGWAVGARNDMVEPFAETSGVAYYTDDGGVTWTERFTSGLRLVFTDVEFTDEFHGYLVGFASKSSETAGSLFRTTDGGENWQRMAVDQVFWQVDFIDSLKGYAVGADYVSAWGPPVYRTLDGGDTWDKFRMEEHDNQGLYGLTVFEDRVIALGDDGYLVQSNDPWGEFGEWNGEHLFTQTLIDTLYQFEDVCFVSPTRGWVAGQKSSGPHEWLQVVLHTGDGGETWEEQYSFRSDGWLSHTLRLNAVQFVSDDRGWAVGHVVDVGDSRTSGILFTDDAGENWVQQGEGVTEGQIVDLFFTDDQTGWALTDMASYPDGNVQLLTTSDAGQTWELVNTGHQAVITVGYAIRSGNLWFRDDSTGWVLGLWQDILRTEDGGATWTKTPRPGIWMDTYAIDFADDLHGTICGNGTLYTGDGGDTWTENRFSDRKLTDVTFTDPVHGWMVGEWGVIFQTRDSGETWEEVIHNATRAALKSVCFPETWAGWAVGRAGTILRIESPLTSEETLNAPAAGLQLQISPNPFSETTEISFNFEGVGQILLAIYDLQGREVKRVFQGSLPPGSHRVIWDGNDTGGNPAGSGIYILRLVTGNGTAAIPVVATGR